MEDKTAPSSQPPPPPGAASPPLPNAALASAPVAAPGPPPMPVDVPVGHVLVIDADLPCVKCGYNLRGTQGDGQCPECGTDHAESLSPLRLMLADPRWLKKLRLGVWLALGALGWLVFAYVMAAALVAASFGSGPDIPIWLIQVLMIGPWIGLVIAAVFLTTSREPGNIDGTRNTWPRRAARLGVIVLAATAAIAIAVGQMLQYASDLQFDSDVFGGADTSDSQWQSKMDLLESASQVLGYVAISSFYLCASGYFLALRRYAQRMELPRLARRTLIIVLVACVHGSLLVLVIAFEESFRDLERAFPMFLPALVIAMSVFVLVLLGYTLVLLVMYLVRLWQALAMGRRLGPALAQLRGSVAQGR